MEYSPPPLFKQGASARVKVVFFSLIALILLVADSRMRSLSMIRQAVGTALYPLQVVAMLPRDAAYMVDDYFTSVSKLQKENRALQIEHVAHAQTVQQAQQLAAENDQLRKLLAATERVPTKAVMSEILYDARDPFTRRIVVDRGSRNGVAPGQPVIDDIGVVGQVTRVFPFTSEVTLLTDKDQAIPVQVLRSGLRSIAYGQGHTGSLDLRFMPTNADIKNGDVLVTSGIDGVYPPGLAVAKVVNVENKSTDAFARISCQPLAGIDRNRHLLILLTENTMPPRPAPDEGRDKKDKSSRKRSAEAAKATAPAGAAAVPADVPSAKATAATPAPAQGSAATQSQPQQGLQPQLPQRVAAHATQTVTQAQQPLAAATPVVKAAPAMSPVKPVIVPAATKPVPTLPPAAISAQGSMQQNRPATP